MEIWKQVMDLKYEASNLGNVRSLSGRTLSIRNLPKNGYPYVVIYLSADQRATFSIARLVLLAFRGSGVGKRILYKNGDHTDVRLDNLEWAEPEGRNCFVYHDDIHRPTKLSWEEVRAIRLMWKTDQLITLAELSVLFEVDSSIISKIVHNKTWKEMECTEACEGTWQMSCPHSDVCQLHPKSTNSIIKIVQQLGRTDQTENKMKTSSQSYSEHQTHALEMIATIRQIIAKGERQPHWGHVGTITDIDEKLTAIMNQLTKTGEFAE